MKAQVYNKTKKIKKIDNRLAFANLIREGVRERETDRQAGTHTHPLL